MVEKELYQLRCDDDTIYLRMTKAQAKLADEIIDLVVGCDDVGFEKYEMPTEILEVNEVSGEIIK